jgi:hypothetical protein
LQNNKINFCFICSKERLNCALSSGVTKTNLRNESLNGFKSKKSGALNSSFFSSSFFLFGAFLTFFLGLRRSYAFFYSIFFFLQSFQCPFPYT